MWSKLKSLFAGRPEHFDDDEPPADRLAFLAYLAQHGAILVASELNDTGMTVVVHKRENGEEVNPLFSTIGSVRRWIQTQEIRQVTPFPSLRMQASWLVNESQLRHTPVLFDPGCPWERVVTPEDLQVVAEWLNRQHAS
jgi:hypothetical protein